MSSPELNAALSCYSPIFPKIPMSLPVQFVPTAFSLGAVFAWGTSDFLGGYASRRGNAFVITAIAHASGLLLIVPLALVTHAQFLSGQGVAWALAAGASGGSALAVFYRALASGRMGLIAPVAAVIGAALPTIVGMFTEGFPGAVPVFGFLLAAIGLWLISRSEDGSGPERIGIAVLAGIGFAGFYLCIRRAGDGSALWLATFSRTGAFIVTGLVVLFQRSFRDVTPAGARWGIIAGFLDVSGTVFFVRASQTGRLDAAVVLSSLYPAITVLLARLVLREHFTRWKAVGIFAAMLAVPLIAGQ